MPWTDPSDAIGVDKPIRASTHLVLFQNFAAMAGGEAGAPRILTPNALRTDATDASLVLQPDGAGGVRWGNPAGAFAGGIHLNLDGGQPVTTVPTDKIIYTIHGTVRNTAYHTIVLPTPSAAIAGHLFGLSIQQTGTYGATHIRLGSTSGSYLAQFSDGDTFSGMYACDGSHWFPLTITHIEPDDSGGD
ncbi:MAG: hypothetical protein FKY71_09720 [Spiribacter salinus]|uniref:Uncharacterized protein n=1 Tax=Spiribacter salinus TaxID=1335746 RepID=A0A540VR64_9GAMM|nr:MAG: hypothetical protein FKY71_09720 [Spiribacter salinus]